jgi:hypothetical protein
MALMGNGKSKRPERRIATKPAPSRYERALCRLHKEHTKMVKRRSSQPRPRLMKA